MPANRCSTCGISFPTSVKTCGVCEEPTDYIDNATPADDWLESVEMANRLAHFASRDPGNGRDRVWRYRRDKFFELGFTLKQADILASVRGRDGIFLYWADVKRRFCKPGTDLNFVFDHLANTGERAAPREALPA